MVEELSSRGDVLYLPRGLVHEAYTTKQASLPVTVAVPSFEARLGRVSLGSRTGLGWRLRTGARVEC